MIHSPCKDESSPAKAVPEGGVRGRVGIALAISPGMIRVLCPTDLSEAPARAFAYAIDFARWYEARLKVAREADARVLLLHVVEALSPPVPSLAPAGPAIAGCVRDLETDAAERLRRVVPADAVVRDAGCPVLVARPRLAPGEPAAD